MRECAQNSSIVDQHVDAILFRLLDDFDSSLQTRNEVDRLACICKHLLVKRVKAMLQSSCDHLDSVRICQIKLNNMQSIPVLFRQLLQICGFVWCSDAGYDKGVRDRKDLQYRQQ